MLSGFQVGHQLKQRSESALCSLLPVHNPGFLLLSGGVLAESVQRNGIVFDATSAQAGHLSAFRCGASAVQQNHTMTFSAGAQAGYYLVLRLVVG